MEALISLIVRQLARVEYHFSMSGYYLALFCAKLALVLLLALGLACRRPRSSVLRTLSCFALLVVFSRLLLFDNASAWKFYASNLGVDEVDFRPCDVIQLKRSQFSFSLYHKPTRYLAVGSSQTAAIFSHPMAAQAGIDHFAMAGMGPLDFYLYFNRIRAYRPACVLLFLSEFDLCRILDLALLKLAPEQGSRWLELVWMCAPYRSLWDKPIGEVFVACLGDIMPELKYHFVFQGLLKRLSHQNRALNMHIESETSDNEYLELQRVAIRKSLTEQGLNVSLRLLGSFLQLCSESGIRVIIVEGEFNPKCRTTETEVLHQITERRLKELSSQYRDTLYLTSDFSLAASDYRDGYHVSREGAEKYLKQLILRLPQ